jgi:hypothetical protein
MGPVGNCVVCLVCDSGLFTEYLALFDFNHTVFKQFYLVFYNNHPEDGRCRPKHVGGIK